MLMVAHLKPKDSKAAAQSDKPVEGQEESGKKGAKKQKETNGDRLDRFKRAKSL
jgi:hypothetical protein